MKRFIHIFHPLEWLYLLIAAATVITFGCMYSIHFLEIFSTLLGLCAASLNMKAKKYCFFFYAVYVAIYGSMAFYNRQYGEGILNLAYNLPLYLFTLYRFYLSKKRDSGEDGQVTIRKASLKMWGCFIVIIPVFTLAYGFALKAMNSNLPFVNALATSSALIASFLASRSYKEQWIFWMGYSAVLIYLWLDTFSQTGTSGLVYLLLNLFYVGINAYGWIIWHRNYQKQTA